MAEVEKVKEKEKELPEVIVTVLDRDGETVVYPEKFEEHYSYGSEWSDYQAWLFEFLEENYNAVCSYYDEFKDISVVIYKLKCQI